MRGSVFSCKVSTGFDVYVSHLPLGSGNSTAEGRFENKSLKLAFFNFQVRIRWEVGVRTAALRSSAHDETHAGHQAVINYIFLTKGKIWETAINILTLPWRISKYEHKKTTKWKISWQTVDTSAKTTLDKKLICRLNCDTFFFQNNTPQPCWNSRRWKRENIFCVHSSCGEKFFWWRWNNSYFSRPGFFHNLGDFLLNSISSFATICKY